MAITVDEAQLDQAIGACNTDNPCEAAWQTAYAYAADQAYDLAVFQALQGIVFAGLQYASADRNADLAYDIANRQMVIAEEEYDRYKEVYVECEDALAAEICAMECPEPDYDTRADRALRDVRKQFTIARKQLERNRRRYCMSDQLRDHCEMSKDEALAVVQARDIAYRYAETRHDYLDERRWDRRVVILQHGRNVKTDSSSQYSSGASGATAALQAMTNNTAELFGTISGGIGAVLNARYAQNISGQQSGMYQSGSGASALINSSVPTPAGMSTGGLRQSGFAG